MQRLATPVPEWQTSDMPRTLSHRTRRVYDTVAEIYPLSTMLFHSTAHRCAIEMAGIEDGMRVLEVATGSGEMFRRIVEVNPTGETFGVDLSPNMAARTQKLARREFPRAFTTCQAVDARHMPFRDSTFDLIVCCYLLELLATEDIVKTVAEFHRVLRKRGKLALILIGQNAALFNKMYKVGGKLAPAFWGRQVEEGVPDVIEASDFTILRDRKVRQIFYPSRVLIARK